MFEIPFHKLNLKINQQHPIGEKLNYKSNNIRKDLGQLTSFLRGVQGIYLKKCVGRSYQ
jgi:hypothetical protein